MRRNEDGIERSARLQSAHLFDRSILFPLAPASWLDDTAGLGLACTFHCFWLPGSSDFIAWSCLSPSDRVTACPVLRPVVGVPLGFAASTVAFQVPGSVPLPLGFLLALLLLLLMCENVDAKYIPSCKYGYGRWKEVLSPGPSGPFPAQAGSYTPRLPSARPSPVDIDAAN
jgi:hypothetical protein